MKSHLILAFIVLLGLVLVLGGLALWHISGTTEFSRVDAQSAPADPIQ